MSEWEERRILNDLERDLGGAELSAVLSEWITTVIHRITAVSLALGWWRTQMIMQGYSVDATEDTLPMMLDRLWTVPRSEIPIDEILHYVSMKVDEDEGDEGDAKE